MSGELFEIGDVLGDVGPSHAASFEGNSSSLLFVGILKLGFKFVEELGPYDGEVVLDSVESVDPYPHVSDPSCDLISFDKGEGEGDFFDWRIESCNVFIDAKVRFDFFDKFISFGPILLRSLGFLSSHLPSFIFPKYPLSSPLLFPFWIAPFALFIAPVLLALLSMISFDFNLF